MLRVLTWNIRHGGQSRVERIAGELEALDSDVVVLTEYQRANAKMVAAIVELGYTAMCAPPCAPAQNSVLIAARVPMEHVQALRAPPPHEHRVIAARVAGIDLAAMYFPQKEAKVALFEWLIEQTPSLSHSPTLLLGDLNTGLHRVDEAKSTFFAVTEFERLQQVGWTDLWRRRHPDAREFSWYSAAPHRNGFRIDHALANAALVPRVDAVHYAHTCRERGASDHSALVVAIHED